MAKNNKKTEIDLLEIDPSQEAAGRGGAKDKPQAADLPGGKSSGWRKRFALIIYILAGIMIISGGDHGGLVDGLDSIQ